MKVVTLSATRTGCLYSPGYNLSDAESNPGPECGRIISMKNFNDTIRNRTGDLPSFSAVPQPTAPKHVHSNLLYIIHMHFINKPHGSHPKSPFKSTKVSFHYTTISSLHVFPLKISHVDFTLHILPTCSDYMIPPIVFLLRFLTHWGRVTQICVFNTVKLGTSASSP